MQIIHRNDTLDIGRNRNFITAVCRSQNYRRVNPITGPMAFLLTGCGLLIFGAILAINLHWLPGDQKPVVKGEPSVEIHTSRGAFTK